jgi:hypothetical protein
VGCYSSSPLKQNLVPRFLSIVVRGAETKLELGLNGCSSNPPMILWVASKTFFCWRCRSSSSAAVGGWRVDVAEVSCRALVETLLRLVGSEIPSIHKKDPTRVRSFQLAIEVLESRGFSGSFCWLGVVASFMQIDGVFNSWCRTLKLDVGVDLSILCLECSRGCRLTRLSFGLSKYVILGYLESTSSSGKPSCGFLLMSYVNFGFKTAKLWTREWVS